VQIALALSDKTHFNLNMRSNPLKHSHRIVLTGPEMSSLVEASIEGVMMGMKAALLVLELPD